MFGEGDVHLRLLEAHYPCQFISRGEALTLAGEAQVVRKAEHVVKELLYLLQQGAKITTHEVRYAMRLVDEGKGQILHSLFTDTILVTAKGRHVRAKTVRQQEYLQAMRTATVTFGIGPAGTGKTYLAVVMAVRALRARQVDRVILTRPAVEAGERLGFLPGDLQEKIDPYLRPLYDALHDVLGQDTCQKLMQKGLIEIAPLAYMRGRTLEDAFVILDEAQNATRAQMKMFLTRLGFGSKMVITGDLTQIDLPRGVRSGLAEAREVLADVEGIRMVELQATDVIRHDVVRRIVEAYAKHDKIQNTTVKKNEEVDTLANHDGNDA